MPDDLIPLSFGYLEREPDITHIGSRLSAFHCENMELGGLVQKLRDEVVQISSDDGDDVPSPRDNEDQVFGDENQQMDDNKMGMNQFEEGEAFDGYNPQDYMNLNVSQDVKQLFMLITDYTPQQSEIDTILRPFIPEYIPTVGEVDVYLKIPRPDGQRRRT